MCLSIPSQVIEVDEESSIAVVDMMGVKRQVHSHLMTDPLAVGDYVLIHIGFIMDKIDKEEAERNLAQYQKLIDSFDSKEQEKC